MITPDCLSVIVTYSTDEIAYRCTMIRKAYRNVADQKISHTLSTLFPEVYTQKSIEEKKKLYHNFYAAARAVIADKEPDIIEKVITIFTLQITILPWAIYKKCISFFFPNDAVEKIDLNTNLPTPLNILKEVRHRIKNTRWISFQNYLLHQKTEFFVKSPLLLAWFWSEASQPPFLESANFIRYDTRYLHDTKKVGNLELMDDALLNGLTMKYQKALRKLLSWIKHLKQNCVGED